MDPTDHEIKSTLIIFMSNNFTTFTHSTIFRGAGVNSNSLRSIQSKSNQHQARISSVCVHFSPFFSTMIYELFIDAK